MANNKTFSQTYQLNGKFDISDIVSKLQTLSNKMKSLGGTDTMFKGIDKQFSKINDLTTAITAQIGRGFSNDAEIKAYEKNVSAVYKALSEIQVGLVQISKSDAFEFHDVKILQKEISETTKKLNSLSKEAEQVRKNIEQTFRSFGVSKEKASAFASQIKDAEDLEKKLKDIAKARDKDLQLAEEQAKLDIAATRAQTGSQLRTVATSERGGGKIQIAQNDFVGKHTAAAADLVQQNFNENHLQKVLDGTESVEEAWHLVAEEMKASEVIILNLDTIISKTNKEITTMLANVNKIENSTVQQANSVSQIGAVNRDTGEVELSDMAQAAVNNSDIDFTNLSGVQSQIDQSVESIRQLNAQMQLISNSNALENLGQEAEDLASPIREAGDATKKVNQDLDETVSTSERFQGTLDNFKDGIKTFLSLGSAIGGLKDVIRQTFEDVKKLDKAFAEIAMVTDYSVNDMWASYGDYVDMAKDLGQTTESVIKASGLFYQQCGTLS